MSGAAATPAAKRRTCRNYRDTVTHVGAWSLIISCSRSHRIMPAGFNRFSQLRIESQIVDAPAAVALRVAPVMSQIHANI